jgi:ATP-binding protein involved in chromosome partitioning
MKKQEILNALDKIKAHSSSKSIVEEGHIKNLQVFGDEVELDVFCPSAALAVKKKLEVEILKAIQENVYAKAKVKVRVQVPEAKAEDQQIKGPALPGVQNIIAVASGKGGVGKSTVTANLAVALADMGFKVGLVDADIYGPSMPIMFDVAHEKPSTIDVDGVRKMDPVQSYGVKLLSIGFFAGANQAVVWRGPMATKALNQLIRDAHWGELDFLIIDLPPGTGDIHLSIVQAVPITGAVVVSTPQPIALADARKGVAMFRMDAINVPVLGLVENMAYFSPPELPDNKYYIFGKDGAKHLAEEVDTPFLGEIPLVQSIREAGDVGRPAILQEGTEVSEAFREMTKNIVSEMVKRNDSLPPTEVVRITTMAGCSAVKK